MRQPASKIVSRQAARAERERLRQDGKSVVFTNGCFDLLHAGHVATIQFAREQGDALFVGVNTDRSVQLNKGPDRPMIGAAHRASVLAALEAVDFVVLFDEAEVAPLITELQPDVLVKGQDREQDVVGREIVEAYGGRVAIAPLVDGLSTSRIIERVIELYGPT